MFLLVFLSWEQGWRAGDVLTKWKWYGWWKIFILSFDTMPSMNHDVIERNKKFISSCFSPIKHKCETIYKHINIFMWRQGMRSHCTCNAAPFEFHYFGEQNDLKIPNKLILGKVILWGFTRGKIENERKVVHAVWNIIGFRSRAQLRESLREIASHALVVLRFLFKRSWKCFHGRKRQIFQR